jgi:hypothetical protein
MSRIIRGQVLTLFSLLVAFAVTLAACGGGSSSGGSFGGGSGITISGVVTDGSGTAAADGAKFSLLIAFADMVIEPAYADGVDGVTVNLYQGVGCGGTLETSDITENGGHFMFSGLAPGVYTICIDGTAVATVDTTTDTEVEVGGVSVNGTTATVEIEVSGTTIRGEVEDEQGSVDDQASSDEEDSEEEDTEDDEEDDD